VVDKLPELLDEPLADSSFVPTYLLSRFARERVKVALGGDGGDEIFAGYPTLQAHRAVEYYERLLPLFVRARIIPALIDLVPTSFADISFDFKARRFLAGRGFSLEVRHHRWMGAFTDEEKAKLYRPEALLDGLDTYGIARTHMQQCDARDALNQLLYLDLKLYLEGDILVKVDRASMANSLEVRVPLLNSRFLDFVNELPGSLKLHRFTTKYLLRKSMRTVLPPEIIRRNKKGFNMPVAKLIQSSLKDRVRDRLSSQRSALSGLFDPSFIETLINEHLEGRRDHRKLLWTLFIFELWQEKHR